MRTGSIISAMGYALAAIFGDLAEVKNSLLTLVHGYRHVASASSVL